MATRILKSLEWKNGGLIKMVAWKVERSKEFPEGIKYSFAFIVNNRRVIGYDNERAKGHHRHFLNENGILAEEKIEFITLEQTTNSFDWDVEEFWKTAKGKQVHN